MILVWIRPTISSLIPSCLFYHLCWNRTLSWWFLQSLSNLWYRNPAKNIWNGCRLEKRCGRFNYNSGNVQILFQRLSNRDMKDKLIVEERMKEFEKDILHWQDYDLDPWKVIAGCITMREIHTLIIFTMGSKHFWSRI